MTKKILCLNYLILLFTLSCSSFQRTPATSNDPLSKKINLLESVSDNSIFHKPSLLPQFDVVHSYNPVQYSVVASLHSRQPQRDKKTWKPIELTALPEHMSFFKGSVTAHYRKGAPGAPTFIVMPGSYATWKRGGYTHQTVSHLDDVFGEPHIIAFPGILTDEMLRGRCQKIPWDFKAIAYDLRMRLGVFLRAHKLNDVGLVGFSGGATLALHLAALDAVDENDQIESGPQPIQLFNLGVIASSPILGAHNTFSIIDSSVNERNRALTTVGGISWSMWNKIGSIDSVLGLRGNEAQDFENRFFSEFIRVDLESVARHCGGWSGDKGTATYSEYFILEGFGEGKHSDLTPELIKAFNRETSMLETIRAIRVPTYIHFSLDDPVLSKKLSDRRLNRDFQKLIDEIRNLDSPYVYSFFPRYGAHVGLVLDPIYPEIMSTIFDAGKN